MSKETSTFALSSNQGAVEAGPSSLADDLLRGIKPIAQFIGETPRRAFYLAERGYIPLGKIGNTWIGSKKALRAHFDRITGGSA